jgi:fatty-acyl-CoA synthase
MTIVIDTVLSSAAAAVPRRVAFTLGDEALTFGDMRERSHRLANALVGCGVRRGDRVAYWTELSLDAGPLKFAVARVAAAFAPLNPAYTDDEVRAVLEYLAPRLLVVDVVHAERADVVAKDLDIPVATMGAAGPGIDLDDLAAGAAATAPSIPLPREDDVCTIFLTSGSTGRPKGVMVSQRATWLRTFAGCGPLMSTSGKGQVVMFGLFHMAGWIFALNAWSAHQPAHFVARADAPELLGTVERYGAGSLYCIPAMWQRILDDTGHHRVDTLEWTLIGTSRVETGLLQAIKERFPSTRTTVAYGSTEVGRALCLPDDDLFRKPGSVGLPVPHVRARVAADGELLLTSDTLMSGYYDLPEETDHALEDGWYHSGDLVECDDEGYYSIVGRKREMIRSGGEWVAPVEVEAALADFPGISEVAVVGSPDPHWGEVVTVAVAMTGGAEPPSVEDLRRHLAGRLAAFKHPRRVMVIDELPRTPVTGQVQRSRLASQDGSR